MSEVNGLQVSFGCDFPAADWQLNMLKAARASALAVYTKLWSTQMCVSSQSLHLLLTLTDSSTGCRYADDPAKQNVFKKIELFTVRFFLPGYSYPMHVHL